MTHDETAPNEVCVSGSNATDNVLRYGIYPCKYCGVTLKELFKAKEKRKIRSELYGPITCADCLEKEKKNE